MIGIAEQSPMQTAILPVACRTLALTQMQQILALQTSRQRVQLNLGKKRGSTVLLFSVVAEHFEARSPF